MPRPPKHRSVTKHKPVNEFDRRRFLSFCFTGVIPLFACGAVGPSARFTPEEFGAVGDGVEDDYDAFAKLVRAVNEAGGGIVILQPGRTYQLDRHIAPGSPAADLVFSNCEGLTIVGNGARIRVKGDIHRSMPAVRSLAGLTFQDCRGIVLTRLELAGGVEQSRRIDGLTEAPSHGLIFRGCSNVMIDDVTVQHFAADGLYIREGPHPDPKGLRRASRDFRVRNSRFRFNARQGLSIIQLRGGVFENCEFSYTGYVDSSARTGPYGAHSPGAGIDIEPNRIPGGANSVDVLTGDILIRGCRLLGNVGAALVAAKYANSRRFIENVTIDSCQIECDDGTAAGRDGLIFDVPRGMVHNCTLRMRDKTAYLGWYPQSDSDPRFLGNQVYGRNPGRNRPIFAVRPTRGSPLIEGNRFIGEHRQPKDPGGAWLVFIDNPNATLRMNSIFAPAAAFRASASPASGSKLVPIVFARARLMEKNTYTTDLTARDPSLAIVYAGPTRIRDEIYRGSARGPRGIIRPIHREAS